MKTLRTSVELTSNLPLIKFYQTKVRLVANQKLFYLALPGKEKLTLGANTYLSSDSLHNTYIYYN